MNNPNHRYSPITTNFCGYDFVSVRVEDVDLYIVSQLPMDSNGINGFPVRQDNIQRDFKAILGNDFPFVKIPTTLNSKKVVPNLSDALWEQT
ncbi:MAG: hypothetical protein ACRDBG_17100 [Waterburya sp.]